MRPLIDVCSSAGHDSMIHAPCLHLDVTTERSRADRQSCNSRLSSHFDATCRFPYEFSSVSLFQMPDSAANLTSYAAVDRRTALRSWMIMNDGFVDVWLCQDGVSYPSWFAALERINCLVKQAVRFEDLVWALLKLN